MSDFENSSWSKEAFSSNYLKRADIYIPHRKTMLDLLASIYRHNTQGRTGLDICDLGCGDGVISEVILKLDPTISATLMDASTSMLKKAKERLSIYSNLSYTNTSFGDIISRKVLLPKSDVFISSQAIHHLEMKDKILLFRQIYDNLNPGGSFINIDIVKAPSLELEELYFLLWRKWMEHMMDKAGIRDETPADVIARFLDPASSNKPDTLEDQLDALRDTGFHNVDCHYKQGIFVIFGGGSRDATGTFS